MTKILLVSIEVNLVLPVSLQQMNKRMNFAGHDREKYSTIVHRYRGRHRECEIIREKEESRGISSRGLKEARKRKEREEEEEEEASARARVGKRERGRKRDA